jgi:hypothetical protein
LNITRIKTEINRKVFKRNKKVLTKYSNGITMYSNETASRKMGFERSENDGRHTPLNASVLKRRTAYDGEFNTYARERDDTALFHL